MISWQLPFLIRIRIGKTEVQGGLTPVKVPHELSITLSVALHKLSSKLHGGIHPVRLRPDVIVGVFVRLLFLGRHKPRVVDGSIADHIVEDDMHPSLVGFLEELFGIVVSAIAWSYLVIVADVVAGIVERRIEEGIKPDGIHAETLHVVEFADDSLDVADAIAVRVTEGLWVDLIEYRILGPLRHFRNLILTCDGLRRGKSYHHRHYK